MQTKKAAPQGQVEEVKPKKKDISILGVSLNGLSPTIQFVIVCALLFFFHVTYGYLQELTLQAKKFPFPWYMVLLQFIYYSLFAYIEGVQWRKFEWRIPRKGSIFHYTLLSLVFVVGRIMGNVSLKYIDFTTKVLLQSARPIPVMLTGIVLLGKRYNLLQYIATALLLIGLVLFSQADASVSATFSLFGVFCGIVNSFSLAFKSNMQEMIMGPGASKLEVAFYGNFIGIFVTIPIVLWYNELFPALEYCDLRLHFMIAIQFFFGYMGSICALTLIMISDSFGSSIASSTRQVLSIVFSFILFGKPCTGRHVVACISFFTGLGLYIWVSKSKQPTKKEATE